MKSWRHHMSSRSRVLLGLAVGAVTALVLSVVTAGQAAAADSPPGACVLQSGETNGDYPAFPAVTRIRRGDLVSTWRLSTGHQNAGGSIMMSTLRRPGLGCGWTAPRFIATERSPDHTIGQGGVAETTGGNLVAVAVRYRVLSPTSARDFRSYVLRSSDDGRKWGPLQRVDVGFAGQSYPSSLVRLANGDLLMGLYGNDNPATYRDWYARVARSSDGGRSWKPLSSIPTRGGKSWTEPELLVDGRRLVMALRYDAAAGSAEPSGAFLTESVDGGRTWGPLRRATSGTSGMPTLGKLFDGSYALAYRDAGPGRPFRYATSPDLVHWTLGCDVTGGSKRRMLYAGFATVNSRSWVVYALENPEGDPTGWSSVYASVLH